MPQPRCDTCESEVQPLSKGVWRKVAGWVQTREGGGVHALRGREELYVYRCTLCMQASRYETVQGELF
jgi:hypothetical protein